MIGEKQCFSFSTTTSYIYIQGGPLLVVIKWSYGAPINGRKYMGNWGFFTPINEAMYPYI